MTGIPVKFMILALVMTLMGGSAAFAAMGGELPLVDVTSTEDESVQGDAYPDNHGQSVSAVARDKEAIGTWTNPSGKVIENHGQAVREAAHNKEKGNKAPGDEGSDDESQDDGEDSGSGEESNSASEVKPAKKKGGNGNGNPGGRSGQGGNGRRN